MNYSFLTLGKNSFLFNITTHKLMYKLFENLLNVQRLMFVAIISCFLISMTSCDGDDNINEDGTDKVHPYKKEGVIRLYSDGEEFIFTNIIGTAFVKTSSSGIGYDTIGRAYTGYPTPYSIIGSMQFIVLNDSLKLYSVSYNYPIGNVAAHQISNRKDEPLGYRINEYDDTIKGYFSGRLHFGFDQEPMIVDSCFFSIQK